MERFGRKVRFSASPCIIYLATLAGCGVNTMISAFAQPEGGEKVLWRTHGRGRAADANPEHFFPYIVAAMEDYFGASLDDPVVVTKHFEDPEVVRLGNR